jgi:GntR family transcriptional regulator
MRAMPDIPLPLYAILRDRLRARILEGALKPGDKLPSEHELGAAEKVSRITVRQALAELQAEGLIVKLHGKGAFVSHPKAAAQTLNRLQGLGEALSMQGHTVHTRQLSLKSVTAGAEVAGELKLAPGAIVYRLQTLRYMEREPLSVNSSHMPRAVGEKVARARLADRDLIDFFERDLGLKVENAQLEISACAAPAREARLLRISAGTPVLRVHRLLSVKGGAPLHTEESIFRADIFRYRLNLRR